MLFLFFDFTPLYGLDLCRPPEKAKTIKIGGANPPEKGNMLKIGGANPPETDKNRKGQIAGTLKA